MPERSPRQDERLSVARTHRSAAQAPPDVSWSQFPAVPRRCSPPQRSCPRLASEGAVRDEEGGVRIASGTEEGGGEKERDRDSDRRIESKRLDLCRLRYKRRQEKENSKAQSEKRGVLR